MFRYALSKQNKQHKQQFMLYSFPIYMCIELYIFTRAEEKQNHKKSKWKDLFAESDCEKGNIFLYFCEI